MEKEIELKYLLKFFWRRRVLMVSIAIVFFILINGLLLLSNGFLYLSTGKVKLSNKATNNKLSSYKDYLLSDFIIESAIVKSNINVKKEDIKNNLLINSNIGSNIYTITLKYKNKDDGQILCKEIINEFVKKIHSYDETKATIYDEVVTSNLPANLIKNEMTYVVISCVLSFGCILVILYFDDTIKSESELDNYNKIGKILNYSDNNYKNNLSIIKTKIKLKNSNNVIFFSTARDINCRDDILSLVNEFSKDSKVLFIDTNRGASKTKKLGFFDLLCNRNEKFSKFITRHGKYDIMESGTIKGNIETLLLDKNIQRIIDNLKKKYDYIILYNSNIIDYSDSLILSKLCDCNYIIVKLNKTVKNNFEQAIESYNQINISIDGIIIIDK